MTPRSVLEALAPPALWDGLRRLRWALRLARPPFEVQPAGFPAGWGEGEALYDTPAVVAGHRAKWPRFAALVAGPGPLGVSHESDLATRDDLATHNTVVSFAYVAARAARGGRLSLLDWGGGPGHYALFARAALPGVEVAYASCDLPAIAALGPELLPGDRFFSDDRCFDETYDLVVASGALHYVVDWQATLRRLAASAGRSLYVTRFPVTDGPSFVYVQHVPAAYGYGDNLSITSWCISRADFLATVEAAGLRLAREFVVGEGWPIVGAPTPCLVRGFLFERDAEASASA